MIPMPFEALCLRFPLSPAGLCHGPLPSAFIPLHRPCFPATVSLAAGQPSLRSPVSFPSASPASFAPSLRALPEANYPTSPCPPAIPSHFLLISWCQLKARTQSQLPSVLITHRSCRLPWSAQEASGTPGRRPSSECDLRVHRVCGEGQLSSAQGWGREPPAGPLPPPSPVFPAALMLVGAARRTWTTTQRRTPWCLPSGSGLAGGTAQSTVRLP